MANPARGLLTGNRGCLVDDQENVVRHHRTNLAWITCALEFKGWRVDLARPNRWTPIFFLDEAVALAAGHRPCGECRRAAYAAYRDAVSVALGAQKPGSPQKLLTATELNRRLADERLRPGRGLDRAADRKTWRAPIAELPAGTVVLDADRRPCLWVGEALRPFGFEGWGVPVAVTDGRVEVLTPPTSVAALAHGFGPVLHPSAFA
ncbi:MAG: hypothetical protein ABIW49_00995 [Knoellia sp.]